MQATTNGTAPTSAHLYKASGPNVTAMASRLIVLSPRLDSRLSKYGVVLRNQSTALGASLSANRATATHARYPWRSAWRFEPPVTPR